MVLDKVLRIFSGRRDDCTSSTPFRPTSSPQANLGPLETLGVTKDQLLESNDRQRPCYPLAPSPGRARAGPPSPPSSLRRSIQNVSSPPTQLTETADHVDEEGAVLREGAERTARLVIPRVRPESKHLSLVVCSHGEYGESCAGGCFSRECREEYNKRASMVGSILEMYVSDDEGETSRPPSKHDSANETSRPASGDHTASSNAARDVKGKGPAEPIQLVVTQAEDKTDPDEIANDISNIARSFTPAEEITNPLSAAMEIESIRSPTPPGYEGVMVDPAPSPEAGPLMQRHLYPSSTYEAEFYDPKLDAQSIGDEDSAFRPELRRNSLPFTVPAETAGNGGGSSRLYHHKREGAEDEGCAPLEMSPPAPAPLPTAIEEAQSEQGGEAEESFGHNLEYLRTREESFSETPAIIPPRNPFRRPGAPQLHIDIPCNTYTEQYQQDFRHDELIRPLKIRRLAGRRAQISGLASPSRLADDPIPRRLPMRSRRLRIHIPQMTYTASYQSSAAQNEVSASASLGPRTCMSDMQRRIRAYTYMQQDCNSSSDDSMPSPPPWGSVTPQTVIRHRHSSSSEMLSTPVRAEGSGFTPDQSSRAPQRLRRPRALAFISSSSPMHTPIIRTPEAKETPNWTYVGQGNSPPEPETPTPLPCQRHQNVMMQAPTPATAVYRLAMPTPDPQSETPTASSVMLPSSPTTDRPLRATFVKPVYRSPSTARPEDLKRRRPSPEFVGDDSGYASARDFTGSTVGISSLENRQTLSEVVEEAVLVDPQSPNWRIIEPDHEAAIPRAEAAFDNAAAAAILLPSPTPTARVSFTSDPSKPSKNKTCICPVRRLWWKWCHPNKYRLMRESRQGAAGNWERICLRDRGSEAKQRRRCWCMHCRVIDRMNL